MGTEKKNTDMSYYNDDEITEIINLCNLYKNREILILTFYNAQLVKLNSVILNDKITIRTIDSSQGMESDIVIVSLTRSSFKIKGILLDEHRICVMLSRAKNNLIFVGNKNIFTSNKHQIWNNIIKYCA